MDTFNINGVSYKVTTTQKETALEKYRKVDNHLILGMIKQVAAGDMKDPAKIEALFEVALERGLASVESDSPSPAPVG
jgi:hypothetical protein